MFAAIAESSGNKARAYNDHGKVVIVQKQMVYNFMPPVRNSNVYVWFYAWVLGKVGNDETIEEMSLEAYDPSELLKEKCLVDPKANYWSPV
jgi:hypothetical protein